ncbi:MAG: acyl-CoA desaturase [Planctomycetes bacterium]|nr:acyl-CoA desaturase [Planctomycetota bacterium]
MPSIARPFRRIIELLDSHRFQQNPADPNWTRSDPVRWIPYIILHAGCLGLIWVGFSWTALLVAAFLYVVRMFAITGFYHRFFSHRTFRTSRFGQFIFAVWGNTAAQRGPLWWAAQHRKHHSHSDEPEDAHSPLQHGLYWSHFGWLTARSNMPTDLHLVPDLAKYPELVFLDRFDWIVPILLGGFLYGLGELLALTAPGLATNGWQMLVYGFFVSTVVLFHATCLVNSLAHTMGTRRFETKDDSRNNLFIAIVTMGEGWHNNHHRYPASARQGFYWWEIDVTYYLLKAMQRVGLVWDIKPVPLKVLEDAKERHRDKAVARAA